MARHENNILHFNVKNVYFKNSFVSATLIEGIDLESSKRNSMSLARPFMGPSANSASLCHNPKSLKLIIEDRD